MQEFMMSLPTGKIMWGS